jgi:hypothetical protein
MLIQSLLTAKRGEACGKLYYLALGAVNVMGGRFIDEFVGIYSFLSLAAAAADSSLSFRISFCVICEFLSRILNYIRRENRFVGIIIIRQNSATR